MSRKQEAAGEGVVSVPGGIRDAGDRLVETHKILEAEALEMADDRPRPARSVTLAAWAVAGALRHLRAVDPAIGTEAALTDLVQATGWEHPAQVLSSPRPDSRAILEVCDARLEALAGASRRRLAEVRRKLERTVRFEEEARRRREQNRELAAFVAEHPSDRHRKTVGPTARIDDG